MEQYQNYLKQQKSFIEEGERQYRKEDTSFELDTFITNVSKNATECSTYFYRQQIILKTMLT
jgi:hypothetical protein